MKTPPSKKKGSKLMPRPKAKPGKKGAAKKASRDFRGMKNGVKDSGPGPSPIRQAMQNCDPGDHEFR